MGACAMAPVLLVNNKKMHDYMTHEKLDQLIEGLRNPVVVHDQSAAELFPAIKPMSYEAAVRLRLDINALPKPFQVISLASRDWSMQSEWYRWSFTP